MPRSLLVWEEEELDSLWEAVTPLPPVSKMESITPVDSPYWMDLGILADWYEDHGGFLEVECIRWCVTNQMRPYVHEVGDAFRYSWFKRIGLHVDEDGHITGERIDCDPQSDVPAEIYPSRGVEYLGPGWEWHPSQKLAWEEMFLAYRKWKQSL